MQNQLNNHNNYQPIRLWLNTVSVLVFFMVMVGGITRLTDSGLSMVDWKPIKGVIPPLSDSAWQEYFDKYKQFPEYKLVNSHITLSEFKFIFFWEWFHRITGRVIGLAFMLPLFYFWVKQKIPAGFKKPLLLALFLGGSQGLLGWYMVKSGLVDKPDVSHYRLAAHLSLAFIIIGYLSFINLRLSYLHFDWSLLQPRPRLFKCLCLFGLILFVQIIYGAFVAGLDAGLGYNTFPDMNGDFLPRAAHHMTPWVLNLIENNAMLQFLHRSVGWIVFIIAIAFGLYASLQLAGIAKNVLVAISLMAIIQFVLGIVTIVSYVHITPALLHQLGALVLLLFTIRAMYILYPRA